jgi:fructose-1-phosphate kinase PfkB-like protein
LSQLDLSKLLHGFLRSFANVKFVLKSTIGAGDTFIAGILYGLFYNAQNWDLGKTLQFANELAGRKVTQQGFSGLVKGGAWSLGV